MGRGYFLRVQTGKRSDIQSIGNIMANIIVKVMNIHRCCYDFYVWLIN